MDTGRFLSHIYVFVSQKNNDPCIWINCIRRSPETNLNENNEGVRFSSTPVESNRYIAINHYGKRMMNFRGGKAKRMTQLLL